MVVKTTFDCLIGLRIIGQDYVAEKGWSCTGFEKSGRVLMEEIIDYG